MELIRIQKNVEDIKPGMFLSVGFQLFEITRIEYRFPLYELYLTLAIEYPDAADDMILTVHEEAVLNINVK